MSDTPANALFLTGDLVFASKVQAAAARTGKRLEVAMSAAALLDRLYEGVRLVLIDLTAPGLDIRGLAPQLRSREHPPALVAYAPHVHEQSLATAVEAGCELVLSRGQFNAQVDALLERFLK
jgi:CheY-like chemotaxis protein